VLSDLLSLIRQFGRRMTKVTQLDASRSASGHGFYEVPQILDLPSGVAGVASWAWLYTPLAPCLTEPSTFVFIILLCLFFLTKHVLIDVLKNVC
jgi:hypothetical protein